MSAETSFLPLKSDRVRAVRGLSEPNLPRMYSSDERAARMPLIRVLRSTMQEAPGTPDGEAQMALWPFFGDSAHARIDAKRPTLEGRRFWSNFSGGQTPADDITAAAVPGIQARHIFEARLSRLAFIDTLGDIANEVLADAERGEGDWDEMEFMPAMFPYSARAWEASTLAENTRAATLALRDRLIAGAKQPFTCVADRMIFAFAAELHLHYLEYLGIDVPCQPLEEALLDNADYLILFDPAWDGIEDAPTVTTAGLDVAGPFGWFGEVAADSLHRELNSLP
jgi:hypothetical protein